MCNFHKALRQVCGVHEVSKFIVLMYHMISGSQNRQGSRYACPPSRFERHLVFLKRCGFKLISLQEVEDHLINNVPIPPRSVALTLDDGYADNYHNAFKIITQQQIPATIFLITGLLEHGTGVPKNRTNSLRALSGWQHAMLTWEQVKEMAGAGISFGSHTITHPRMTDLDEASLRRETAGSKTSIESELKSPVRHFAYPYGIFDQQSERIVRETGFKLAFSTRSGFNTKAENLFTIRRIEVNGTDNILRFWMKLTFGVNRANLSVPALYYCRRLKALLSGYASV